MIDLHLAKDWYADVDEVEVVVDTSQLKERQQIAAIVSAGCDISFLSTHTKKSNKIKKRKKFTHSI